MNVKITDLPLIGILRGFQLDQMRGIIEAVSRGGLRNIEITMNSAGAEEQIRAALQLSEERLNIGAGTVTTLSLLDQALAAGASFIVTPGMSREIVAECVRRGVPVCPGAYSPTEIYAGWELGATMVKVFPAEAGGVAYVRGLRGPFPQIKLLPTGGIELASGAELLRAGATGLGVGSPLFNKEKIDAGDWRWLEQRTAQFVALFHSP